LEGLLFKLVQSYFKIKKKEIGTKQLNYILFDLGAEVSELVERGRLAPVLLVQVASV